MPLIRVEKLSAYYENKEVFKDLTFSVGNGEYICITGENGSGKTTLMRCILGFPIKHTGRIVFDGITKRDIGWLPQRTEAQSDFPASVSEVIMSGFSGKSIFGNKKQFKQTAAENMAMLEIADIRDRSFKELSGGQQQKVLLCRAMCSANKVLLLDEPVTGLDAVSQSEMYSLIKRINGNGITVIMISHDISRAVSQADRILHISNDGYFFGTSKKYRESGYYFRIRGGEV